MIREHIVREYDSELARLQAKILEMGDACESQLRRAVKALAERDTRMAEDVVEADAEVNRFQKEADEMAERLLATRQPMAGDLRRIISALKIAADLERVADYSKNIARHVTELNHASLDEPLEAILRMAGELGSMLRDVLRALSSSDEILAEDVFRSDAEIDRMYTELLPNLICHMSEGPGLIRAYAGLLFVARCCERIGDHIAGVGENVYYAKTAEHLARSPGIGRTP
jgi:phosphate transport system protein